MSNIHPLSIVEPGAKIGENVTVEPFAVVKGTVTLEDNVIIKSHAYIDGYTTIGSGTVIWPGACVGAKTQDLKFRGEKTFVSIGKNCEIREGVTINSSCLENTTVKIGDNCLIMAYCHVAHNCEIGNGVIMANNALLAGHVIVEDYAIIGGMTPVHQFSRIGKHAMVGGMSRVHSDIPPFTIGGGSPYKFGGINIVGLKRHQFSLEIRIALAKAFKITYRSGLGLGEAIAKIEREIQPYKEVLHWLDFCRHSKRGLLGLGGLGEKEEVQEQPVEELVT